MQKFGNNNCEKWKQIIVDGERVDYMVSNFGRVLRIKSNRILRNATDKDGYEIVNISYNKNKRKCHKIHRLVAQAFIPNPNNYPIINHKDEIKSNNNVGNLEWCTPKYNVNYGTCPKRISETKKNNPNPIDVKMGNNPKARKTICDGKVYDCLKEVSIYYNVNYSTIKGWMNQKSPNKIPKYFIERGLKFIDAD